MLGWSVARTTRVRVLTGSRPGGTPLSSQHSGGSGRMTRCSGPPLVARQLPEATGTPVSNMMTHKLPVAFLYGVGVKSEASFHRMGVHVAYAVGGSHGDGIAKPVQPPAFTDPAVLGHLRRPSKSPHRHVHTVVS